ncbi:hypothetical protein [Bacillus sp. FJAT-50079]|uniref:hypothetical protein n=1 Tax=Bacillus sp. FJAT-50079 TaxID=2833577 RepID=UPI001BC8FD67|nr:hypothetical protein [Bacillus sp. FJAT-50079]MBS4207464.1 hypothetical protein [Bacillus sp. FJAT-50079]
MKNLINEYRKLYEIEVSDNFNFGKFVDKVNEVENDLNKFNKLAEVIEQKYPFITVSTGFDVDEQKLEEFLLSFLKVD